MISIPVKSRIPPHMRDIYVVFPTQHNTTQHNKTTIIMTKESYATAAALKNCWEWEKKVANFF
jgi:hypothetical protein